MKSSDGRTTRGTRRRRKLLARYKSEIDECYVMQYERGFRDPTVLVMDCRDSDSRELAEELLAHDTCRFPSPKEHVAYHIQELKDQGKLPILICGAEWNRDFQDMMCLHEQELLDRRGPKPLDAFRIMVFSGDCFLYTEQHVPLNCSSKEVIAV
jgi:hypothetical protein